MEGSRSASGSSAAPGAAPARGAAPAAPRARGRSDALSLAPPNEPSSLRCSLRRLARDQPAVARDAAPTRLASALGEAWHVALGIVGATPRDLQPVLEGSQREIWLWVVGNRSWAQLAGYLAARVERHLAR